MAWPEKKLKVRSKDREREMRISKCLGCSENSNKRKVYIITVLSQETREIPSKQPNITS